MIEKSDKNLLEFQHLSGDSSFVRVGLGYSLSFHLALALAFTQFTVPPLGIGNSKTVDVSFDIVEGALISASSPANQHGTNTTIAPTLGGAHAVESSAAAPEAPVAASPPPAATAASVTNANVEVSQEPATSKIVGYEEFKKRMENIKQVNEAKKKVGQWGAPRNEPLDSEPAVSDSLAAILERQRRTQAEIDGRLKGHMQTMTVQDVGFGRGPSSNISGWGSPQGTPPPPGSCTPAEINLRVEVPPSLTGGIGGSVTCTGQFGAGTSGSRSDVRYKIRDVNANGRAQALYCVLSAICQSATGSDSGGWGVSGRVEVNN